MGKIIKKSVKIRYRDDEIDFLKTYYPFIHNEDLSLMMGRNHRLEILALKKALPLGTKADS
jgi:hypothetical protein